MEIIYHQKAQKTLKKMDNKTANLIMDKIDQLAEDTTKLSNNITPLSGPEFKGIYRLRVGNWRVFFNEDGEILNILKIGPRGGVYKNNPTKIERKI